MGGRENHHPGRAGSDARAGRGVETCDVALALLSWADYRCYRCNVTGLGARHFSRRSVRYAEENQRQRNDHARLSRKLVAVFLLEQTCAANWLFPGPVS